MYNDTYVELLVRKKTSPLMLVLRVLTMAFTAVLALLGVASVFFLLAAIICGVGAYFVYLNADLEYEYLYVDKQLSIDKVMAKSRRKKLAEFDLQRMEVLAPITSYHLDEYKNRNYKTLDFSSGTAGSPDPRYVMYYNGEQKVILEPDGNLVKAIQNIAPRKVFFD